MKRVIYTCITGGYDKLREPETVDGDFDYICFTDAAVSSEEGVWQIRPIPYSCDDPTRLSRYVKLLPDTSNYCLTRFLVNMTRASGSMPT